MYTLARHCSLFSSLFLSCFLFLVSSPGFSKSVCLNFPRTLGTRYQYHYEMIAIYIHNIQRDRERARWVTKKPEWQRGRGGMESPTGMPLDVGETETQRHAISDVPALCGTRMAEAALSILYNVSCRQN
ncbi:hypothetical protein F5883DRAFT_163962 [Diaporthe sp. PMI_573]|nr:hypothetical protein F5883DRAFT_163962 [Diaporthaceae sp. PMI_573]